MKLHDLIKFKALSLQNSIDGELSDNMLASIPKDMVKENTRNVCALISLPLFNDLDHVCTFLHISKRTFIEAAIAHAVHAANAEIAPLEEVLVERYQASQEAA